MRGKNSGRLPRVRTLRIARRRHGLRPGQQGSQSPRRREVVRCIRSMKCKTCSPVLGLAVDGTATVRACASAASGSDSLNGAPRQRSCWPRRPRCTFCNSLLQQPDRKELASEARGAAALALAVAFGVGPLAWAGAARETARASGTVLGFLSVRAFRAARALRRWAWSRRSGPTSLVPTSGKQAPHRAQKIKSIDHVPSIYFSLSL
jgi:hypothetical protein